MPTPVAPSALTAITAFPPITERAAGTYNQHAYDWATQMASTRSPELAALASNVYDNAVLAGVSATTASAAATVASGALSAMGAVKWVSGTTYAIGDVRYSPINMQSYRRKTTGAGTTDPSTDTTNWAYLASGSTESEYTLTGTTPALNVANGTIQKWTLTANSTPTDGMANGQSMILMINDGTAYSVTWPSVVWTKQGGGGSAPSLNPTTNTVIVLWKTGGVLYGSYLGDA